MHKHDCHETQKHTGKKTEHSSNIRKRFPLWLWRRGDARALQVLRWAPL
jgi:hypothetical protein